MNAGMTQMPATIVEPNHKVLAEAVSTLRDFDSIPAPVRPRIREGNGSESKKGAARTSLVRLARGGRNEDQGCQVDHDSQPD